MLHTIKNDKLSLTVNSLGAEIMSLMSHDGVEYIWYGDAKYWGDRAPNLFPFIGRLTNNSYKYRGKVYPMTIHGFAAASEFAVVEQGSDSITMELTANETTLASYPFEFTFKVTYTLVDNKLDIGFYVENRDQKVMPFGVGGHPGFNVPLVSGEKFEDYTLEFSQPCNADRIGFTPTVYLNGVDEAYPLEDGKRINLKHDLFDDDAIILKNMDRQITLRSKVSGRGVTVEYGDFCYLGIWHWPKTDAPYVCIEPWTSSPSRQDVVEEFTCKSDMIQLGTGKSFNASWSVTAF